MLKHRKSLLIDCDNGVQTDGFGMLKIRDCGEIGEKSLDFPFHKSISSAMP